MQLYYSGYSNITRVLENGEKNEIYETDSQKIYTV